MTKKYMQENKFDVRNCIYISKIVEDSSGEKVRVMNLIALCLQSNLENAALHLIREYKDLIDVNDLVMHQDYEDGNMVPLLYLAADNYNIVKLLIGLGADVNKEGCYGSAVYKLCSSHDGSFPLGAISLLLRAGADPNQINKDYNETAIERAKDCWTYNQFMDVFGDIKE